MTDFVWVAGHTSLDLCNTAAGGLERLTCPEDQRAWLVGAQLVCDPCVTVSEDELKAAIRMRDTLRGALLGRDRQAVARAVAGWLDGTPGRLAVDANTLEWRFLPDGASMSCLLVAVALDALRIARELPDRVRECAADRCDVLYLDTSRNHSRRWCSMERCGARAKSSAYYQRHRGEHDLGMDLAVDEESVEGANRRSVT